MAEQVAEPAIKPLTAEQMAESRKVMDRMSGEKPEPVVVAAPNADAEAAKLLAAQKEAEAKKLAEAEKEKIATATKPNLDEISEEDFLALYEKRTGQKAKSLDDLKPAPKALTKEEKEAQEVREQEEALAWALENKIITKDLYDKSKTEKAKNKRDIALALFTAEQKADDPDITSEDAEVLFREAYGEDEEAGSWKHKRGMAAMNKVADEYLAQYSTVDNLPEQYREARTADETRKTYNKQVSAVAKELPKELSFKIPYETVDGAKMELEYKVAVSDDLVPKLIKEFTRPGMENAPGFDKPETIAAEMNYHVRARSFDVAIASILKQHEVKVETDILARVKNARNPNQAIGIQQAPQKKQVGVDDAARAVLNKMK